MESRKSDDTFLERKTRRGRTQRSLPIHKMNDVGSVLVGWGPMVRDDRTVSW